MGLGGIPPRGARTTNAYLAFRSAAGVVADVPIHHWLPPGLEGDLNPSGVFLKGQQQWSVFAPDHPTRLRAQVGSRTVLSPVIVDIASHRYEWILVGTNSAANSVRGRTFRVNLH